jgi:molybdopterin-guanine dinucleotide biosynthesis protein A
VEVTKSSPEFAGPLTGMEEGWLQSFEKLNALLTGGDTPTDVSSDSARTRRKSRWRR